MVPGREELGVPGQHQWRGPGFFPYLGIVSGGSDHARRRSCGQPALVTRWIEHLFHVGRLALDGRQRRGTSDRVQEAVRGGYAVHPDGNVILYFSGTLRLAKRGEAPVDFPVPNEVIATSGRRLVGFSPDGTAIACIAAGQLWLLPYPAGEARRFPAAHVQDASWMPDSRRLVLTRTSPTSHTLSMLDAANGNERVVYSM